LNDYDAGDAISSSDSELPRFLSLTFDLSSSSGRCCIVGALTTSSTVASQKISTAVTISNERKQPVAVTAKPLKTPKRATTHSRPFRSPVLPSSPTPSSSVTSPSPTFSTNTTTLTSPVVDTSSDVTSPSGVAAMADIKEIERILDEANVMTDQTRSLCNDLNKQAHFSVDATLLTFTHAVIATSNRLLAAVPLVQQLCVNGYRVLLTPLVATTLPIIVHSGVYLLSCLDIISRYSLSGNIGGHIPEACQGLRNELLTMLASVVESTQLRSTLKLTARAQISADYDIPPSASAADIPDTGTMATISSLMGIEYRTSSVTPVLPNSKKDFAIEEVSLESKGSDIVDATTASTTDDPVIDIGRDAVFIDASFTGSSSSHDSRPLAFSKLFNVARSDDSKQGASSSSPSKGQVMVTGKLPKEMLERLRGTTKLLANLRDYAVGSISADLDPGEIPTLDLGVNKPKYSLLAMFSRPQQMAMINQLRSTLSNEFRAGAVNTALTFEFVLAIDNSGSMFGSKIQFTLETVVLLLEVFRRMEWKCGVVRFGTEQKILKKVDESLSTPDRYASVGQCILESFPCDEKTLPATALRCVAESADLFGPTRVRHPNVQRVIIMITDGISQQRTPSDFLKSVSNAQAQLYMVCIRPSLPSDQKSAAYTDIVAEREAAAKLVHEVAPKTNCLVDRGNVHELTSAIAHGVSDLVRQSVVDYAARRHARSLDDGINKLLAFIPSTTRALPMVGEPVTWTGRCYASNRLTATTTVATSSLGVDDLVLIDNQVRGYTDVMPTLLMDVTNQHISLSSSTTVDLSLATREFDSKIEKLEPSICEIITTFEDGLLIPNVATHGVPDTRGSRLYMPGLVQFICTQGQYSRIYLNHTGGLKAQYRIALIIDQSLSMEGPTLSAARDAFLTTVAALQRMGIEDFSVIIVGSTIEVVKVPSQVHVVARPRPI
jgi:Mg-chelatase subunit ChlD